MAANGISTLSTKEERQLAKLELAQTKRQLVGTAGYRSLRYLDITELPTVYSGNTVVDNPNVGGLVQGRPWKTTPNIISGLWRTIYDGYFNDNGSQGTRSEQAVAWFDTVGSGIVIESTEVVDFSLPDANIYSLQYLGYFRAPHTANYTFYLESDDEAYFWIGDSVVTGYTAANADLYSWADGGEKTTDPIALQAGEYYPIRLQYGNVGGPALLNFSWSDDFASPTYDVSILSWTGDLNTGTPGDVITTCNEGDTIFLATNWANLTVPGGPNSYLQIGGTGITEQDLGSFGPASPLIPIPWGAGGTPGPTGPYGAPIQIVADNLTEGNETLTWSWYVNGSVVASASVTIVDTSVNP